MDRDERVERSLFVAMAERDRLRDVVRRASESLPEILAARLRDMVFELNTTGPWPVRLEVLVRDLRDSIEQARAILAETLGADPAKRPVEPIKATPPPVEEAPKPVDPNPLPPGVSPSYRRLFCCKAWQDCECLDMSSDDRPCWGQVEGSSFDDGTEIMGTHLCQGHEEMMDTGIYRLEPAIAD